MKITSVVAIAFSAMALVLSACGGATQVAVAPTQPPTTQPSETHISTEIPPTATPQPSDTPTPVDIVAAAENTPTPTPAPTATPSPAPTVDWLTVESRTTDGLPLLGNPDAPITVLDYSDFL